MNPIAGNFDAARWQEVCNEAKELADIPDNIPTTMNIQVEGNEPAIVVNVTHELMSLAGVGKVTIDHFNCTFKCTMTVETDAGPVTASHGIEHNSKGEWSDPLARCLLDLRHLWNK